MSKFNKEAKVKAYRNIGIPHQYLTEDRKKKTNRLEKMIDDMLLKFLMEY